MTSFDRRRDTLILPVAGVVLLGWLTTLAYAVLDNQFVPLTIVTPLMFLLAGYAFGTTIVRTATKENHDEDQ